MGLDDPVIWVLVAVAIMFLFGASRIPKFARSLGLARKEFQNAMNGTVEANTKDALFSGNNTSIPIASYSHVENDPLVLAAQKEGIDTTGKSREQIASELSWKLNKS